MYRRRWLVALTLTSLLVFGTFLLYIERIIQEVRTEAALHTRIYALVQSGLLSLDPGAELEALLAIQATLKELGVPVVIVNAEGDLYAAENLPFELDQEDPASRRRALEYARDLNRHNAPISEPGVGTIHFGLPPIISWLRWAPWLQVGVTLALGALLFSVMRSAVRAERELLWAATARELAHQMATPLSALSGWVEVLRLTPSERDALVDAEHVAAEIGADVERLERVSRRFELIGQTPALEAVPVAAVVHELESYLRPRLPRLGAEITLRARVRPELPPVRGNRVLLVWALENLVKNSLDALAGRGGGQIRIAAAAVGQDRIRFSVADTGPGILPAARERIFEPGYSTKLGGWGVGLSLTRRIVEDLHGGRITVRTRRSGGAIFELDLPVMKAGERPGAPGVSLKTGTRGEDRHAATSTG
jgi:signal transduction histidine kinase